MHFYLVHIQFLGYRYHGWIKQPNVKTIQGAIEKALGYVLGHTDFKTLGSSRTDAKVSANQMAFELFLFAPILKSDFIEALNVNLPSDIRILNIKEVDKKFNAIKSSKVKEYVYLFSFGEKAHPFAAPLMANFPEKLNLELMQKGATLFEGVHNFMLYTKGKNLEQTNTTREILLCEIKENDILTANFFPQKSFALHIHANGFLRYQVRLIMGQLVALGNGKISIDDIIKSLSGSDNARIMKPAPAAGLILNKIIFDD